MVGLVILSVTDDVVTEAPEIAVVVDGLKRGGPKTKEKSMSTISAKEGEPTCTVGHSVN